MINVNCRFDPEGFDDNANRVTSLENTKSDTSIIASYGFTLDGNGNRIEIIQNEPLTQTPSTDTVSYTYNTQKNRLLTAGTSSFGYDNEGQLNTGYGSAYTFDYEHRLIAISNQPSAFSYDGTNNRLQAVRNGVTTRYIYDAGGNLLAEADNLNNITKYYIHGLGLMAMVTPANEVYTYHYNAVGSTIAMTDSSQTIVNKYSYDPFGNVQNQNEAVQQPFKFVGQHGVMTEPNGFYYMKARYYDPNVGRFISEDPKSSDVNLYQYAGNNPLTWSDPLGLYKCTYDVSSHSMICIPDHLIFPVFESNNFVSGNNNFPGPVNNAQNNPDFENVPFHGPIPQGEYDIGPQRLNSSRRNLTPSPSNNMYGRSGFQTHGCGNPATCSEGCIAATTNKDRDTLNRLLSNEEGQNTLNVKP